MEEIYRELLEQNNVRANLSALRKRLKEGADPAGLGACIAEHESLFMGFLASDDAKTRKNAALLLGDVRYEPAIPLLYRTYEEEKTLFVRSAYLEALGHFAPEQLKADGRLAKLRTEEQRLSALVLEPLGDGRKHVEEELRAVRRIISACGGSRHHAFDASRRGNHVLLTVNPLHREVAAERIPGAKIHPLGVEVWTDDLAALQQIRTYRELLFLRPKNAGKGLIPRDPKEAAESIASWMVGLCEKYCGSPARYLFRVECRSAMPLEERSRFVRQLGAGLELQSRGALVNSPGDYEVELRLVETRAGTFFPCVKFLSLADHRFDYRKNAISASIQPSTAALIMELARPYLKEGAQLWDPFCGVGTMLIERDNAVCSGDRYGTDIFGEAILFARENAALAGKEIHFIHRDFMDFRHSYKFDEIITNMPRRGKRTKEEQDALYAGFFEQAEVLMNPGGVIVMYTNEAGFVKKQLRLRGGFALLQETLMQQKADYYLMIIERKG